MYLVKLSSASPAPSPPPSELPQSRPAGSDSNTVSYGSSRKVWKSKFSMSQTRMPSHGHDQVRFLMSFVLRVGDDVLRGWGTSRGHRGAVSLKTGPALLGDLGEVAQGDWTSASQKP